MLKMKWATTPFSAQQLWILVVVGLVVADSFVTAAPLHSGIFIGGKNQMSFTNTISYLSIYISIYLSICLGLGGFV